MQKEDIEYFLNRNVKIVLIDKYVFYGIIVKVSDDSFFFKTKTKTSLINNNAIEKIVEW